MAVGTLDNGIWSDEYTGDRFVYAATRREPRWFDVPHPRIADGDGVGPTPFGTVQYARPLTPAEQQQYGLWFLYRIVGEGTDDLDSDPTLPRERPRATQPGEPFTAQERAVLEPAVDAGLVTPERVRAIRRLDSLDRWWAIEQLRTAQDAGPRQAMAKHAAAPVAASRR